MRKEQELQYALGNLLQWAVGNRGTRSGNPYAIPEIREALQALAVSKGWSEGKISHDWYDAADSYRQGDEIWSDGKGRFKEDNPA